MGFDELFGSHRVMVILRGLAPAETVTVAHAAWDAGVELLEVPIATDDQLRSLVAAVAAGAERGKLVGAGTVITSDQVRAAALAGARYTVAPGFDRSVLASSLAAGLPHLPGVGSATEVQHARAAGCQWVKAFPAVALGPAWFRALQGPFPQVRYVATGGVTVESAPEFLAAGASVVAVGSALTDSSQRDRLADLIKQTSG